jgi:hypothetical protein
METEMIDKLFLELSQVTKAVTAKEADLSRRLAQAKERAAKIISHVDRIIERDRSGFFDDCMDIKILVAEITGL